MLSAQREKFCQNIADGMSKVESYQDAYPKCKTYKAAASCAFKLLKIAIVAARIQELQQEAATARCATRQEKRELLASVMRGEIEEEGKDGSVPVKIADRLNALKIDNAMEGHDAPIVTETDLTVNVVIQEKF